VASREEVEAEGVFHSITPYTRMYGNVRKGKRGTGDIWHIGDALRDWIPEGTSARKVESRLKMLAKEAGMNVSQLRHYRKTSIAWSRVRFVDEAHWSAHNVLDERSDRVAIMEGLVEDADHKITRIEAYRALGRLGPLDEEDATEEVDVRRLMRRFEDVYERLSEHHDQTAAALNELEALIESVA